LVGLALCCVRLSLNRLGRLVRVCLGKLSSLFSTLVVWFAWLNSSLAAVMLSSDFLLIKYMHNHVLKKQTNTNRVGVIFFYGDLTCILFKHKLVIVAATVGRSTF
jgi:hypothetical protein